MKVEFTVDEKWEASYKLNRESLDIIYKLADLLQCKEIEDLNIETIELAIKHLHEKEC